MFEEEQRLRRGLELSEMQKLDKLLGSLHLSFLLYFVVVALQFIKIFQYANRLSTQRVFENIYVE